MSAPDKSRMVRCPACQGPALFSPENRWRPFCSQRCRELDLGAWASEEFRMPAEIPQDGEAPPDPSGPQ